MTSNEMQNKLNEITQNLNREEFICDLLPYIMEPQFWPPEPENRR